MESPNFLFEKLLVSLLYQNQSLTRKAYSDALTGVWNRLWMDEHIDELFQQSEKKHIGVLMVDLDHFKGINDRFGHQKGDEVLQAIAQVLRNNIREEDSCIRYGGEEFLIVLKNVSVRLAKQIANRLRIAVSEMASPIGERITASIGVVTTHIQPSETKELLKRADDALYEAKRLGRNRIWMAALKKEPHATSEHRTN